MSVRRFSRFFAAVAVVAAGPLHAAPVDLGVAGTFNVYTLGNFSGSNSSVEGAAAAAGNFAASSYSINQRDVDGAGGYALAAGGSVTYSNGSIRNGLYYAGPGSSFSGVGFNGASATTVAPFDFTAVSADLRALSRGLATVDANGSSAIAHSGLTLTGSGASTTVFDLSGSALSGVTHFSFDDIARGDTLILNVSGADITLQGGWNAFRDYNVLFNFYQATSLDFNGGAIHGSVLAPLASVHGGSGSITGNVIVGSWDSSVALNADGYFRATDVSSFAMPAAVPEPQTYALMLLGLGVVGWIARNRKADAGELATTQAGLGRRGCR